MRLLARRLRVPVARFDTATGRWAYVGASVDAAGDADRDELTLTTYNIWFDSKYAEPRYRAIAELLSRRAPDIMVFQEVTPTALDVLLGAPWIRTDYASASVVGDHVGNYGLLMLSRLPVTRVTYTRLPSRLDRGYLTAEFSVSGARQVVCCIHLDSGKSWWPLRAWQLRRIFGALRRTTDAVVLGDFNMRDDENERIPASYRDVWTTLRPDEDGFTEDTAINHMRYDMKNKSRQVRFDRVLLKGPRWTADEIELLGTEPIADELPRIFPSDHFGVWCRLRRRNPSEARHRR